MYHYTSSYHWPAIDQAGYLAVTDPNISIEGTGPGVVWLTDVEELTPGDPDAKWARGSIVDKTEVRITVEVADATPWAKFAREHHVEVWWYDALARSGGDPERWFVVARAIPRSEWTEVRVREDIE